MLIDIFDPNSFLFFLIVVNHMPYTDPQPSLIQVSRHLKFMFSKKATKIDEIFTVDLTLTT